MRLKTYITEIQKDKKKQGKSFKTAVGRINEDRKRKYTYHANLKNYLEESYAQDIAFAKKRLIKFIDNIEHSISIMKKAKIKDDGDTKSLNKIYTEIGTKTKNAKITIKNAKVNEMFEPDVMSKNILRRQIQSIEKQLKILDNRLNKGFLDKTKVGGKLRSSFISVWNKLQGIYKIIGR